MRLLLVTWISLVAAGCGPARVPTYPVSGRVVFSDGEPVRTGTIELESEEFGTTATGTIREDGSFVLGTYTPDDGAAPGRHRAIVVQIIINDGLSEHTKDHGRTVPPLFGDYDTSNLTVVVEERDENDLTVTLEQPENR
ncbi:MAG: carboxypeptidase regulatory-like domain-containing protein [Planctomycetaceae bacterium]|nr:carboxypeptidase regulatory-like domain-containing protein [Planctomycetaceae bacterium]